jgi:circadian clock protein KaiB
MTKRSKNISGEDVLQVRLYVAANSRSSSLAKQNLETAIDVLQPQEVDLEVIDVTEQPQRAAEDRALVTPLLVRVQPTPVRKVGGTLDDPTSLLAVLAGAC